MPSRQLTSAPRARLAPPRRLLRLRSDAALAERFADGDEAAFAILFERHRASVLAVCIGVLGSRHDAEDAAQEAFAALAVSLRSSPPRELRAWLARVARNAAIDVARHRRTRESLNDELSGDDGWSTHGMTASQGVKDELESVVAGIRELPEAQRTALLMRELAGHSYREIAGLLETDEDAVRGLIARARIGLRRYREAAELPCAAAREAIATEPDGRRHDRTVRCHLRGCAACRAYRSALREDAKALRGLAPVGAGGAAGGGALVGIAAKGAMLGGAVTQVTATCAVSVCAVGGIALLAPGGVVHRHPVGGAAAAHRAAVARAGERHHELSGAPSRAAATALTGRTRAAGGLSPAVPAGTRGNIARLTITASGSLPSVAARGRFSVPAGGRAGTGSRSSRSRASRPGTSPSPASSTGSGAPTVLATPPSGSGAPGHGSNGTGPSGSSLPTASAPNPAGRLGSHGGAGPSSATDSSSGSGSGSSGSEAATAG